MTSKDSDLVIIRDLDTQLKEYKRKYDQARIAVNQEMPLITLTISIG